MANEPEETNVLLEELKKLSTKVTDLEARIDTAITPEAVDGIVQQVSALTGQLNTAIEGVQKQIADMEFVRPEQLVEIQESLRNAKAEQESLTGIVRTLVEWKKPSGGPKPLAPKPKPGDKPKSRGFGPPLIS